MIMLVTSSMTVQNGGEEMSESFGILIIIIYSISLLVSLVLSNIIYVNAGLMYYDSRTDLHRDQNMMEIDSIGGNEV